MARAARRVAVGRSLNGSSAASELEKLCRYAARPAVAQAALLRKAESGKVVQPARKKSRRGTRRGGAVAQTPLLTGGSLLSAA